MTGAGGAGEPRGDEPATAGDPVTERGPSNPDRSDPAQATETRHHPRDWALWKRPKRFIVFLFAAEIVAAAIIITAFLNSWTPTTPDWVRFAILAAGATIHLQFTQRQEERRRNRTRTVLIDLTAVWVFPATLVLPLSLTLALITIVRVQHWFIARRPAHNFVFSSITHGLAGTVATLVFTALGPHSWGSFTSWTSVREFGIVVLTGLAYEGVQILYIGGILTAGSPTRPSLATVLGNKADNLLEAITIGLGAVNAILVLIMPPMVGVMAVVTVVFNRLAELDQLQDDARTDPKTGILNMRGWSESAERAFDRTTRSGDRSALLMIDLDHFKWINDSYGHPAGDDVLRTVAQTLGEVTRPSDLVGRFGGEEFLVLLPEITETSAHEAAERIRSAVAKLHIATTGKRGDPATISDRTTSIGLALYPDHGRTLDALLQAADQAVYEAKANGRNQVFRLPPGPPPAENG